MLYAMIDLSHKRVIEVLPLGEEEAKEASAGVTALYIQELTELHTQLTGKKESFKTLEAAKRAVLGQLGKRYFGETAASPAKRVPKDSGPVATARGIIQELAGHPRRDIIEACAKAGVKRSTAGTQYQRWCSDHRAQ